MDCVCTKPGLCPLHDIHVSPGLIKRCQAGKLTTPVKGTVTDSGVTAKVPLAVLRPSAEAEKCIHLGPYLTPDEIAQYRSALLEGKIPCKTCAANAPDGIPARHCRDTVAGVFTFAGKCMGCLRWDDGMSFVQRGLQAMPTDLGVNFSDDRGVILCGGGDYQPSLYVTVKMLRTFDPDLPIALFHGANEVVDAGAFKDIFIIKAPENIPAGWPMKSYALLKSPFIRSLFLDADFYPIRSVAPIFETPSGAFCLNYWHETCQWDKYGLTTDGRPGIDGGCWMIDRMKHWKVCWLYYYLNTVHHAQTYNWSCGDEGQLRAALRAMEVNYDSGGYAKPVGPARLYDVGVHRVDDKFRHPGTLKLNPLRRATPCSSLPYEAEAFKFFYDFSAQYGCRQSAGK